ncbi:hypothetical protein IscW_ISCW003383 [Ixodes scapularis]|uniref:Uncharacterized protein n=1 Tax=Ixodes scapularis TaxID=6945 RepID=B7PAX6_IXOSC|nr:hypothetical protein IscW_ISCW003383 [Ixodes scapularis]|eukprot:XP_002407390.1 hypothetical protein IscW_ISCW003383 [Ixodes scapularis]
MYADHSPTVDLQVRYLLTKFDPSCRQFLTTFVSVSGGYTPNFHQGDDLLPPSVRIVPLHVSTNDLASHGLQHYLDLLHYIQTKPGIQLVFCCHILPRIINRHLHSPNRHFTDTLSHRAGIFNHFAGVDIMDRNLRALIPCILWRTSKPARSLGTGLALANARGGCTDARHGGPTRTAIPHPATPHPAPTATSNRTIR